MSALIDFLNEKNEIIGFDQLFTVIAEDNNISYSDAAAFIYRSCFDVAGDIKPDALLCYVYNHLDGFDAFPFPEFQINCFNVMRALAENYEFEYTEYNEQETLKIECGCNHFAVPNHYRGDFLRFCFRKSEVINFLSSLGLNIPSSFSEIACRNIEEDNKPFKVTSIGTATHVTFVNGRCGYDEVLNPLEDENKMLKEKTSALNEELNFLRQQQPLHLNLFDEVDPLALAIEVRNKFWMNYDPKCDRQTRPKSPVIIDYLTSKGITKDRRAKAIDLVASPINRDPSK